ncbi:MAG: Gfo/Idh/MocA family oxidoreductase [Trueperaceae bacterium]|nr:Gfo/Idh/MocA family oxidoreductase [Trueperaceae bacterium]
MTTPLPVALIGAGRMGGVHARLLGRIPECRVVAVVDGDLGRAREVAEPLGAQPLRDAAELGDSREVPAVVVSTPVATHAPLALQAIEAGRALFVEKPLADTLRAAREVAQAARRHGAPVQVGYQRRYDAPYVEARRRIDAGELGRLEGFRGIGRDPAPPPLDYLIGSGDLLVDMGGHDLDSARFLVGEVARVHAIGGALALPELAEHGLCDTAVATLQFENGAVGTLEVGLRTAYGYEIRAEVLGEHGRLHVEVDRRPALTRYDAGGGRFDRPRDFLERFESAYQAELAAFVRGVRRGEPLTPDADDACKSLRLALAAQYALDHDRPVEVASFEDDTREDSTP